MTTITDRMRWNWHFDNFISFSDVRNKNSPVPFPTSTLLFSCLDFRLGRVTDFPNSPYYHLLFFFSCFPPLGFQKMFFLFSGSSKQNADPNPYFSERMSIDSIRFVKTR